MFWRSIILLLLLAVYGGVFSASDSFFLNRTNTLHPALPAKLHRVVSGYLCQLVSEMLFVKTSVFLGNPKTSTKRTSYEVPLASNFQVMTRIYPEFKDPYYFTQSFLAPISKDSANWTQEILNRGIQTYPDNNVFRLFHAFNFFNYLNDPLSASKAFAKAAERPGAPPMFEHLAALFQASGGDISAGLVMLKTMLATEQNKIVRKRYQEEIAIFEKALLIEKAIKKYTQDHGNAPAALNDLVPEYLTEIPEIDDSFILTYKPPILSLERPEAPLKHKDSQ